MESDIKLLFRLGTSSLRKAAKHRDYFNAVWTRRNSNKKHAYRISCRRGGSVYLKWAEIGAYPPRGLSTRMTIGDFLKEFELLL